MHCTHAPGKLHTSRVVVCVRALFFGGPSPTSMSCSPSSAATGLVLSTRDGALSTLFRPLGSARPPTSARTML